VSEEATHGTGQIDEATEQHVKDLEGLVSEYKGNIHTLETEIQELAKRPALDQGSGIQALREELADEKLALQEARRGMSLILLPKSLFHYDVFFPPSTGRERGSSGEG
jgi:hypothetical protein